MFIFYEEISPARKRPRGRPPVSWLQRIDGRYQELGLAGRAHAWYTSSMDPRGWHLTVIAATHPLVVVAVKC